MIQIDEIRARAEAATPGPWQQHRPSGEYVHNPKTNFNVCMTRRSNDANFIAHAREDIPALIAEVERLWEALKGAQHIAESAGQTIKGLRSELERMTAQKDAAVKDLIEIATGDDPCEYCNHNGSNCNACCVNTADSRDKPYFEWQYSETEGQ